MTPGDWHFIEIGQNVFDGRRSGVVVAIEPNEKEITDMNEADLDKSAMDWFLPLKHESFYWSQFTRGGRTFLDVGAHVGTWTLNLAKHFERVFAFEPDPRGWRALQRNLEINKISNVTVVRKAVTDKAGKVMLTRFPNPSTNTIMPLVDMGRVDAPIDGLEVESVSLDEWAAENHVHDVDFIKVDAEGAEMKVVAGALSLLRQAPDFWIEMHGLFYDRLREMMPFVQTDMIDGGRHGLSLARHRSSWPDFETPDYCINPTVDDMRKLRAHHGIVWEPPGGFLAADYKE